MSTTDSRRGAGAHQREDGDRDRERASSRASLIAAALDEFAEKGYEAATVAGIAERAGVTTGALYAHFESKIDLLLETIGMKSVENFVRTMHTAAALPWNEAVEVLAEGFTRRPSRRSMLLIDVIVVARRDRAAAAALRRGLEAYLRVSTDAARAGVAAGLIDPAIGAEDLSRLFAALNFGLLVLAALDEAPPSDEAFVRLLDVLLQAEGGEVEEQPPALNRVRACAAAATRADRELAEAIAAAAGEGHSLRRIGQAAGLSHERVRRMLGRRHDS